MRALKLWLCTVEIKLTTRRNVTERGQHPRLKFRVLICVHDKWEYVMEGSWMQCYERKSGRHNLSWSKYPCQPHHLPVAWDHSCGNPCKLKQWKHLVNWDTGKEVKVGKQLYLKIKDFTIWMYEKKKEERNKSGWKYTCFANDSKKEFIDFHIVFFTKYTISHCWIFWSKSSRYFFWFHSAPAKGTTAQGIVNLQQDFIFNF